MYFTAHYTKANEALAARAKANISYSDYQDGSATATVTLYTDRLVAYADQMLDRNPTDDSEKLQKVQDLIDRYSAALAAAIDKDNEITCRCPSVMISGGSNFPIRKKEKQNEAAFSHWEKTRNLYETDSRNWYYNKIRLILTDSGIIKSDDPDAVKKIRAKIDRLEAAPDPYGNNSAEIRRLKGRLLELAPDEVKEGKAVTINGEPATFAGIVSLFDKYHPMESRFEAGRYYLAIPLVFSDGKRKYREFLSDEVNADCTELSTYGNAENNFRSIWKPLDDRTKFYLVINKISGSGNKAVMYSILKDLDPEAQKQKAQAAAGATGDGWTYKQNTEIQRVQFLFDGKPDEETRSLLKSHGFRWAPSQGAWQRQLTDNGRRAAQQVIEALKEA